MKQIKYLLITFLVIVSFISFPKIQPIYALDQDGFTCDIPHDYKTLVVGGRVDLEQYIESVQVSLLPKDMGDSINLRLTWSDVIRSTKIHGADWWEASFRLSDKLQGGVNNYVLGSCKIKTKNQPTPIKVDTGYVQGACSVDSGGFFYVTLNKDTKLNQEDYFFSLLFKTQSVPSQKVKVFIKSKKERGNSIEYKLAFNTGRSLPASSAIQSISLKNQYYTVCKVDGIADNIQLNTITTLPNDPCSLLPPKEADQCRECMYEGTDENDYTKPKGQVWTGLGCVKIKTTGDLFGEAFKILSNIIGGIAMLLLIYASILFMVSGGDAEKIKKAKSILTAVITGILFVIFSIMIMKFIGLTLLELPTLTNSS